MVFGPTVQAHFGLTDRKSVKGKPGIIIPDSEPGQSYSKMDSSPFHSGPTYILYVL